MRRAGQWGWGVGVQGVLPIRVWEKRLEPCRTLLYCMCVLQAT